VPLLRQTYDRICAIGKECGLPNLAKVG
jgi:hypothetical protein